MITSKWILSFVSYFNVTFSIVYDCTLKSSSLIVIKIIIPLSLLLTQFILLNKIWLRYSWLLFPNIMMLFFSLTWGFPPLSYWNSSSCKYKQSNNLFRLSLSMLLIIIVSFIWKKNMLLMTIIYLEISIAYETNSV